MGVRSRVAAAIHSAVLVVLGTDTQPLWMEVADFLRSSLPHVEDCTIDGIGHPHTSSVPEPLLEAMAEFLGSNSMAGD